MTEMTLDELLGQFAENLRPKVINALDTVRGLAVYRLNDQVKALALTPDPEPVLDDGSLLVGTYVKPDDVQGMSRTQQALLYLKEHTDATPYAAAVKYGLDPSAVYRAIRRAAQNRCPCCGQTIRQRRQS
jgi:hypothetical protein